MVIRRRSGSLGLNAPLRIWLMAGASSLALAIVVMMFTARTVQADALLPQPSASVPLSGPAILKTATPALTTKRTIASEKAAMLRGIATWYGDMFNGRKTASGETFDKNGMTACHPTLPFGSLVKVVNLKNKRSVIVRITDRGDLAKGRIINLSFGAAEKLAMTEAGLAPVALQVLSRGRP